MGAADGDEAEAQGEGGETHGAPCYTGAMLAAPPALIGMIHLLPLPGSPRARPLDEVWDAAARDAERLVEAGFDAVMVENFGDVPFLPGTVEPITLASMAVVLERLRLGLWPKDRWLGVNVLRNDAEGALALAVAVDAQAIRINVHQGARVTDQGIVVGQAGRTARARAAWGARSVGFFCDVDVKHSTPLGPGGSVRSECRDLIERGLADAVIVSGSGTGEPVDEAKLGLVVAEAGKPVYIGSGATLERVPALLSLAHGIIVGTALKLGGKVDAPVDPERARAFVEAVGALRG